MTDIVRETFPLGSQWPTLDPFLFVAHHNDAYPAANADLGPDASLAGREIGQDFAGVDGWNMYHGSTVPGFPQHPHRGFETVTYVRKGIIDHADSLGATARFGRGDTQWLTAGGGIQHCEMFPLLDTGSPNPLELFQIWLNLPAEKKMVDPYFTMLWSDDIPTVRVGTGPYAEITVIAGALDDGRTTADPASPPPDSWASEADAEVAIWHIRIEPGASWTLPAVSGPETQRVLYAFEGSSVDLAGSANFAAGTGALIDPTIDVTLSCNGDAAIEILMLQGRPIAEPVAQYGPFVMNTVAEIRQTFDDYQRTQFGGWPWPSDSPNHGADRGRFALHADGTLVEKATDT